MGAFSLIILSDAKSNVHNSSDFIDAFMEMQSRGPDNTSYITEAMPLLSKTNPKHMTVLSKSEIKEYIPFKFVLGYHRLSINDLSDNAMQPFEDPILHKVMEYPELRLRPCRKLVCNGEIYNYNEIKETESFTDKDLQSQCDVEVIMPLYIKHGIEETLQRINGDFSFAILENPNTFITKNVNVFVARDSLGLKPLYMIKDTIHHNYIFSTEIKGIPKYLLNNKSFELCEVPPGTYWSFQNALTKCGEEFTRYADWSFYSNLLNCSVSQTDPDTLSNVYKEIKEKLTTSVVKRYSNKTLGVLLSGGFDSSIILAILIEYLMSIKHDFVTDPISTFTIGDPSSLDVIAAQKCINYFENKYDIDIQQHFVSIADPDKVNNCIDEIVVVLETWDQKTIKSSIPFYYLFKYISQQTNVKILLTGEGLDEICGYNDLFKSDDQHFQASSIQLLTNMHKRDLLRAEKIAAFYGIETRHPFLDTDFLEYMLSLHPRIKRPVQYKVSEPPIEKYIVRRAFAGYLDEEILWRRMKNVVSNNKLVQQQLPSNDDYYKIVYNKYFAKSA